MASRIGSRVFIDHRAGQAWPAPRAFSDVDQTISDRDGDGLRSVCRAELSGGGLRVLVDGSLGNAENFSDFPCRLAERGPCQDLALARRQGQSRLIVWRLDLLLQPLRWSIAARPIDDLRGGCRGPRVAKFEQLGSCYVRGKSPSGQRLELHTSGQSGVPNGHRNLGEAYLFFTQRGARKANTDRTKREGCRQNYFRQKYTGKFTAHLLVKRCFTSALF